MTYKDAVKWIYLGFKVRRKRWPPNLHCQSIEEKDGKDYMNLNNMRAQPVTNLERTGIDWEKL